MSCLCSEYDGDEWECPIHGDISWAEVDLAICLDIMTDEQVELYLSIVEQREARA